LSSLGLGVVEGGVELGRWSLLPVDLSVGLICKAVSGRGEVPSVDEGPVAVVGDVILVKEGEDSAALFVSGLGDIEYGSRGAVCEAVAWWAKLSSRMMGRGLPGAKARGWSPQILSHRRRTVA
jgi:hypothetical protein